MTDSEKPPVTFSMRCRNPKCPSMTAVEIPVNNPVIRRYCCVKCNVSWPVSVGGAFNLRGVK